MVSEPTLSTERWVLIVAFALVGIGFVFWLTMFYPNHGSPAWGCMVSAPFTCSGFGVNATDLSLELAHPANVTILSVELNGGEYAGMAVPDENGDVIVGYSPGLGPDDSFQSEFTITYVEDEEQKTGRGFVRDRVR